MDGNYLTSVFMLTLVFLSGAVWVGVMFLLIWAAIKDKEDKK